MCVCVCVCVCATYHSRPKNSALSRESAENEFDISDICPYIVDKSFQINSDFKIFGEKSIRMQWYDDFPQKECPLRYYCLVLDTSWFRSSSCNVLFQVQLQQLWSWQWSASSLNGWTSKSKIASICVYLPPLIFKLISDASEVRKVLPETSHTLSIYSWKQTHTYSPMFFFRLCVVFFLLVDFIFYIAYYRPCSQKKDRTNKFSGTSAFCCRARKHRIFQVSAQWLSVSDRAKTMSAEANKKAEFSYDALEDLPSSNKWL